jgi:hypothetical protein
MKCLFLLVFFFLLPPVNILSDRVAITDSHTHTRTSDLKYYSVRDRLIPTKAKLPQTLKHASGRRVKEQEKYFIGSGPSTVNSLSCHKKEKSHRTSYFRFKQDISKRCKVAITHRIGFTIKFQCRLPI